MEVEEVIRKTNEIKGWFNDDQMLVLYPIVKSLKEGSIIVEIGTFYGKSARFFSLCNPCTKIYTIDVGGFENCPGIDPRAMEVGNIVAIKASSEEVAKGFGTPIDFLFIDGSHKRGDVLRDLEMWTPYLCKKGSWLVCHDYEKNFQEVMDAVDEWKSNQKNWKFRVEIRMLIAEKGGEKDEL